MDTRGIDKAAEQVIDKLKHLPKVKANEEVSGWNNFCKW